MKIIEVLKGLNSGNRITPWSGHRIIKIDGSSTIHPIIELVAEEFRKAKRGAAERFTQGVTGTIFKGEAGVGMRIKDLVKLIETH